MIMERLPIGSSSTQDSTALSLRIGSDTDSNPPITGRYICWDDQLRSTPCGDKAQ
jgi:hypothetical protein